MKSAVGRADLVRVLARAAPRDSARLAWLLGYDVPQERPVESAPHEFVAPIEDMRPGVPKGAQPVPSRMPFWRQETAAFADDDPPPPPPKRTGPGPLTEDEVGGTGSMWAMPSAPPLASWSRLWPALRGQIQAVVPGREPDVSALVSRLSCGEVVRCVPRIARQAWPGRVSVWVDRSARLVPFFSDQEDLFRRLRKVCGRGALSLRVLNERTLARARRDDLLGGFRPEPDAPVLVLGDLGLYAGPGQQQIWRRTAQRLRRAEVRIRALVPVPRCRWDRGLSRLWGAEVWERGRGLRQDGDKARAERLLRLISPAAIVQPGLLRALRLLLPAWQADAATEAAVWGHASVRAADISGLVLDVDKARLLRGSFGEVTKELRVRVAQTMEEWHRDLPEELRDGETLIWRALDPGGAVDPPGNVERAIALAGRLAETVRGGGVAAVEVRRFGCALLGPMPDTIYRDKRVGPDLGLLWAASFQGVDGVAVPAGVDPAALYAQLGGVNEVLDFAVHQAGDHLVCLPWAQKGAGSQVARLRAARPHLYVSRIDGLVQMVLRHGVSIPLNPGEAVELRTDRCAVVVLPWQRERWAVAVGRDRFGLWADAEIAGVVQRFRWIPPGRFVMGSPKEEEGRWDDEGPQHGVTFTRGFWLGDTPVTQALWVAVMEKNPSRFQSPDRPVEQVSWQDCKQFLGKLDAMAEGLGARLPTEAEWEYACRGGTTGATWGGDLEIFGENNAPRLDDIAWYGGNSGLDYELEEGEDSSGWRDKQYPHKKAGTHPVKKKRPNPLGLYDMLGNVYEWCEDSWPNPYSSDSLVDPGPFEDDAGSRRVFRGGSWYSLARVVRAASRDAYRPASRDADLGFRLVRGQGPGQAGAGGDAERPQKTRGAGRTTGQDPARDETGPSNFGSRRRPK